MGLEKKVKKFNKLCGDLNIPNHRFPYISEISITGSILSLKFKKLVTSLAEPFYVECESEDFEDKKLVGKFILLNLNNPYKVNHFINELNEKVDWKNIEEELANKLVQYIEDNNIDVDIFDDDKNNNTFNKPLTHDDEKGEIDSMYNFSSVRKDITEYVKNHNQIQEISAHYQMRNDDGIILDNKDFLAMLQLGIPIGVIEHYDSNGNVLLDDMYEQFIEVKHLYKPINDLETLKEYLNKVNCYPELTVNPNYMTKQEVKNICFCLNMINNNKIFDSDIKTKIKIDIANAVPVKYNDLMQVFNRYFDETIQRRIIYGLNVGRNRFYFLSGLNELVPKKSRKKEMDVR